MGKKRQCIEALGASSRRCPKNSRTKKAGPAMTVVKASNFSVAFPSILPVLVFALGELGTFASMDVSQSYIPIQC